MFDVKNLGSVKSDQYDILQKSDDSSSYVSGVKRNIGINTTPTVIDRSRSTEFKVLTGSEGKVGSVLESKGVLSGRMSWQEIR